MTITYELKVKSEYHIGTGLEHPGVVDRTLMTRLDGTLVIPAEHFRGLVRDACTQIIYWRKRDNECCEASLTKAPLQSQRNRVPTTCGLNFDKPTCIMCGLFGTTFTPGKYEFFDAVTEHGESLVSMHNRVDPATGRVPEETFFSFQVGVPQSKADAIVFTGKIEQVDSQLSEAQRKEELGLLFAGLRLVERVGARSGRGWGRARVTITQPTGVDEQIEHYVKNTS